MCQASTMSLSITDNNFWSATASVLGITNVNFIAGTHHLAIADATLAGTPSAEAGPVLRKAAAALPAAAQAQPNQPLHVTIDNFAFAPKRLNVKAGSTVDWTNKDDTPHTVTSDDGAFSSPVIDTDQKFQFTFQKPGNFPYHCKLHPTMTAVVVVQ